MLAPNSEKAIKKLGQSIDSIKNLEIGDKDLMHAVVDNFDWFIVKDEQDNFKTIPVWALKWNAIMYSLVPRSLERDIRKSLNKKVKPMNLRVNPEVWMMPTNIQKEYNDIDLQGKAYCVEINTYIKDVNITKELEQFGYKVCGLCRGEVMEDKHPVVQALEKNLTYKSDDKVEDVLWLLAKEYTKKITEQYNEFVKNRKDNRKKVGIDTYGLAF